MHEFSSQLFASLPAWMVENASDQTDAIVSLLGQDMTVLGKTTKD